MGAMKVRDVMTERVITVREDAPVKEVVEVLVNYDVSGVPVLDMQDRLVGMVTEGDLLGKEAGIGPPRRPLLRFLHDVLTGRRVSWHRKIIGTTAREVMTAPVQTAGADESLRHAAQRMMRTGVKRLPVVEDERVIGMVSRHDILGVFDRPDAEVQAAVQRVLARAFLVPPEHDITATVADGVVTLEGLVRFEADSQAAQQIVRNADGVIGVENRLGFRLPGPHFQPV